MILTGSVDLVLPEEMRGKTGEWISSQLKCLMDGYILEI